MSRSQIITLHSAGAVVASVNDNPVPFRETYNYAQVLLNVASAAGASGDTLDVFIDASPDGGTTWYNVGHFTQVLGNGGAKKFLMSLGDIPGGSSVVAVGTDQTAGNTAQLGISDRLRCRSVIAGSTPSFNYTVTALLK